MHIIITGVHMEMTEAIRAYTLEKMKSLEKYVPHDDTSAKLAVELSKTSNHHVNGQFFQAEAQLHIRGKDRTVRTTQDDLYKAIDVLKDMLARELATHKDKERSIFRRSAHRVKQLLKRIKE
ncbi:MAG: Ribosomal protein S30Ae/sigma 54 modulation protein [Candidatus Nomurabacteria bacterium]|nr:Ribosomal protein S30Ae/sigma 54 modulation protein [Candidatus Nomurabacteria bacterium]